MSGSGDEREREREREVRRLLELYQEQLRTAGDPPAAPELPAVDLATLLGKMAALEAVVRRETEAARELRQLASRSLEALEEAGARNAPARPDGSGRDDEERGAFATAEVLIDLADRLEPALVQAAELARPRGWLRRRPAPAAQGLHAGLGLTLRRIEDHLRRLGVQRMRVVGAPFDPHTMQAEDTTCDPARDDGVVVEEIVAGYATSRGALRPARVVVNRYERETDGWRTPSR